MLEFDLEYHLPIIIGIALGVGLYFVNCFVLLKDSNKNRLISIAVFSGAFLLTVPSVFGLNYLAHPFIYGAPVSVLWGSGLAFHMFYMLGFMFLYSAVLLRLAKLHVAGFLNAFTPSVAFVCGAAKIGCILAGCCGGAVNGTTVPAAEIECAAGLVLFILLQFVFKKDRAQIFLIIYAPFRFCMEFLRVKQSGAAIIFGVLTPEQIFAIIIIIAVIAVMILKRKKAKPA